MFPRRGRDCSDLIPPSTPDDGAAEGGGDRAASGPETQDSDALGALTPEAVIVPPTPESEIVSRRRKGRLPSHARVLFVPETPEAEQRSREERGRVPGPGSGSTADSAPGPDTGSGPASDIALSGPEQGDQDGTDEGGRLGGSDPHTCWDPCRASVSEAMTRGFDPSRY